MKRPFKSCKNTKSYFTVTSLTVNSAHLEYLTPEREDVAFLEDYESMSDFDSIWQLEKVRFFYLHTLWTVNDVTVKQALEIQ